MMKKNINQLVHDLNLFLLGFVLLLQDTANECLSLSRDRVGGSGGHTK